GFQRTLKELQGLKKKKEIPVGAGNVGEVGGIGQSPQRNLNKHGHRVQNHEGRENGDDVFHHLLGKESFGGAGFIGSGRHAVFSHQKNVEDNQRDDDLRQDQHVQSIKTRESNHPHAAVGSQKAFEIRPQQRSRTHDLR